MNLTKEQKQLGKENFENAVASARRGDPAYQEVTRRSFLKGTAAIVPGLGAAYFGYQQLAEKDKVKVGLIGTGKEGGVLITELPADYMHVVAIADMRPSNRRNAFEGEGNDARIGLNKKLGTGEAKSIKAYPTYQEMLEKHPEIEAVVIAVPLSQHFKIARDCIEKGKHVLTEKLMCWSVKECKDLIRFAKDNKKLLAVGHQRHYSALYDNSNFLVRQGILGDVKFIRAQWHRNTSFDGRDSWKPKIPQNEWNDVYDKKGNIKPDSKLLKLLKDEGYDSLEQLCRWRLYNKTGGGLMAELGSHQLDACSIFLGKVRPIAVQGYGGKNYFGVKGVGTKAQQKDDREVDDHVYVTIEFPGPHYAEDKNDKVIVTYSSINTNSLEPYGETIFGSRGTMMVHNEQETLLFKEAGPNSPGGGVEQRLWLVQGSGGKSVVSTSESLGPASQSSLSKAGLGKVSRGYTEEMEHFCYAVRNAADFLDRSPKQGGLKCNGEVAMADAIMALTSNLAMDAKRRIVFKDEWFDSTSDATPETDAEIVGWIKEAKKG